jgi:antirestriction protein ArdC
LSKGRFGNSDYAFEELVAELGAAFLCQQHGIKGDLRHAGYIESWLKCLKNDSRAIFKASALAQQAADFIIGCSLEKPELVDDSELLAA